MKTHIRPDVASSRLAIAPARSVVVELSERQAFVVEHLANIARANAGEVLAALAFDRLASNLVYADAVDAELRSMLWTYCHRGEVITSAGDEWEISDLPATGEVRHG